MKPLRPTTLLLAAALAGCVSGKTSIESGDISGVQVNFGEDAHTADPMARQYCAQYERVPRFIGAENHVAYYACELR